MLGPGHQIPAHNREHDGAADLQARSILSDSFDAILNQLGANLDVIGKWCAGTQLPEPLLGNLLRKFPKPEY